MSWRLKEHSVVATLISSGIPFHIIAIPFFPFPPVYCLFLPATYWHFFAIYWWDVLIFSSKYFFISFHKNKKMITSAFSKQFSVYGGLCLQNPVAWQLSFAPGWQRILVFKQTSICWAPWLYSFRAFGNLRNHFS